MGLTGAFFLRVFSVIIFILGSMMAPTTLLLPQLPGPPLRLAASANVPIAPQIIAAQTPAQGSATSVDPARYASLKKAVRKLQAADLSSLQEKAAAGDGEAEWMLGLAYDEGYGVAVDREKAMHWYQLSAAQGYPPAENAVGVLYAEGSAVPRDPAEAVRWYRLAAEHGFFAAQTNLAMAYSEGFGVRRDDRLAVEWAGKAAEQHDVSGQNLLGWAYAEGKGVRRDTAEALRWFRLAAEQGAPGAAYNLGISYRDGKGVDKNREEAIRWFTQAAEAGWVNAAYEISALYFWRGWFDHRHDYVNAYAWCLIGQEMQRHASSEYRLPPDKVRNTDKFATMIAKEMGVADITAAQTIASEWIKTQAARREAAND